MSEVLSCSYLPALTVPIEREFVSKFLVFICKTSSESRNYEASRQTRWWGAVQNSWRQRRVLRTPPRSDAEERVAQVMQFDHFCNHCMANLKGQVSFTSFTKWSMSVECFALEFMRLRSIRFVRLTGSIKFTSLASSGYGHTVLKRWSW